MSANSTPITVVGRVISDIDVRVVSTGAKVANFRVLSQERFFDKAKEAWVDGDRMYLRVACWRRLAENVAESVRQGDLVVVYGVLKVRQYETSGGVRQQSLEIEARCVGPDLNLHTVMVNRPDWAISPNQQTLVNPPPIQPVPKEPDEGLTQEDVAQAA